jgi:hypothetical protein
MAVAAVVSLDPRRGADVVTTPVALRERVGFLIQGLAKEADKRVGQRLHVEARWTEDLEQYHGVYDSKTRGELAKGKGARSQLFIGATRSKTNALEARIADMLFPTDEKNWGMGPTPVPELAVSRR